MFSALHLENFPDSAVDAEMDRALRELLSTCFTKPQDYVFRERRYFSEMPAHRWVLRDEGGGLRAHLAVHEKVIEHAGGRDAIGGIAEVCVRPADRGRGYVRELVAAAHEWLRVRGTPYGVLFGDPRVYASSGYRRVENLVMDGAKPDGSPGRTPAPGGLVAELLGRPWPEGEVYLPGLVF